MYNSSPTIQSRGFFSDVQSAQRSDMSRPSGKSIYMQRKEYTESINRQENIFQYRVEHLFTCELNERLGVRSAEHCVEKLKSLDSQGKVWGQDMILQVQKNCLQLCDIETKEVLESLPLSSISQTKAVLDSCKYDSLLMVTVQDHGQKAPCIFVFQCEDLGAEEVRAGLNKAVQNKEPEFQPSEPPFDIRANLENILGQGYPGSFLRSRPPSLHSSPPPPAFPPPQPRDYHSDARPSLFQPKEDYSPDMQKQQNHSNQLLSPPYTEIERSVDVLNHVITDIEIFMDKVTLALRQEDRSKKIKNKGKSQLVYGENCPSVAEYVACLQKFKYGFNLLGKLNGHLTNPDPSAFVHSFFSSLEFLLQHYPAQVAPSVLSPLLTEPTLQLLDHVMTTEEDRLWKSLGDAWTISRSRMPNADHIPPYIPLFYDGWQPPAPVPLSPSPSNGSLLRSNSQRFPDRNGMQPPPIQNSRSVSSPYSRSGMLPMRMQVIYDFLARNHQELSVMKGDVVQVVDDSRQWWTVRNRHGEEGHVPPNILEPLGEEEPARMNQPPNLDISSTPEEVRAWLQYKGFSKSTIHSLGMMNGALLLRVKRDELRVMCPEEGGRVFFHLQAIKSSMALASEAEYSRYNGQYA